MFVIFIIRKTTVSVKSLVGKRECKNNFEISVSRHLAFKANCLLGLRFFLLGLNFLCVFFFCLIILNFISGFVLFSGLWLLVRLSQAFLGLLQFLPNASDVLLKDLGKKRNIVLSWIYQ